MKKLSRILISLILVMTTMFSVACSMTNGDSPISDAANPKSVEKTLFNGTHVMTADEVETEDYIIKDGNLEYQILIPENPSDEEVLAYQEFKLLLKRAMGNIPVSVVYEKEVFQFDENAKYISIGQTKLLGYAGVEYDAEQLGYNGVRIQTIGKSIFLVGGKWYGIVNAVYDFFNICFNLEVYSKNCITIDTNVKNLKLRNFNVTDIPDIEYNTVTHGPLASYLTASEMDYKALQNGNMSKEEMNVEIDHARNRMRFIPSTNQALVHLVFGDFAGETASAAHTIMLLFSEPNKKVPGNENIEMTSDWFAQSGNQICWKAHGNEQALEDMKTFAANYFISLLKKNTPKDNPAADYLPFTNWDGGGYCECEYCLKSMADNGGTYAASNIEFANDVIDKIQAAMDAEPNADWIRPDFKILMLAYDKTSVAPSYYDEEAGKYVTYNGLEVSDHICIWNTKYPIAYTDVYDEDQLWKLDNVKAWGDIVKHQWVWDYSHHYNMGAFFLDNVSGFSKERYQHMAAMHVKNKFTEVHSSQEVLTTWFDLTTYWQSKLVWDSNADTDKMINGYFDAMFGPAAKTMKSLFYNQKIYTQHMYEEYERKTGDLMALGNWTWTQADYPYQVLKGWADQIQKALQEIEIVKTFDMDLYEVYRDRIDIEGLQYLYVIYRLYNVELPPYTIPEKEEFKERMVRILDKYHITWCKSSTIRAW